MARADRKPWSVTWIVTARAFAIGLAYYSVIDIPGLTSSFVAIFVALLAFDTLVAKESRRISPFGWGQLLSGMLPRISGTALTLMQGLVIGSLFGISAKFGLPMAVGSIMTVGLAYTFASSTRGSISTYVGMLGGLAVFEAVRSVELSTGDIVLQVAPEILTTVYGTFSGLFRGWLVGFVVGFITRVTLTRGYRSVQSAAYDPPLVMQPFHRLLHLDGKLSILRVTVNKDSMVADESLSELNLKRLHSIMVLSILRRGAHIALPSGEEKLLPGDRLLVLAPSGTEKVLRPIFEASDDQKERSVNTDEQGV